MWCPLCRIWQWLGTAKKNIFRNKLGDLGEELLREVAAEETTPPPPPPGKEEPVEETWLLYRGGSEEGEIIPLPRRSSPPPPPGWEGKIFEIKKERGKKNE